METPTHDLYDFFKKANHTISEEYVRICRRVKEDPGTAGDQGEENWKELLESWLPSYFHIVTKGRIIGTSGITGPQVDVLVLSPDYPKSLWGCKEYLAGGVVAAFECKTTLRRQHIGDLMEHAKRIQELTVRESGTPRRDLQSKLYYGLLAHSHEWKREGSRPKAVINRAIYEFDSQHITHPREMPDTVCVADIGTWKTRKGVIPLQQMGERAEGNYVFGTYVKPDADDEFYTPVGAFIFDLLNHIAWQYPSVREIVTYMRSLALSGSGEGTARKWSMDLLSAETKSNLAQLHNGGFWNEWNMVL